MHLHNGMNEMITPPQCETPLVPALMTPLLSTSEHMLFKHNLSNIFAMLGEIEQEATHGKASSMGCDCNPEGICELVVNIRKHLNTMLQQCTVAGRCPIIKEMLQ